MSLTIWASPPSAWSVTMPEHAVVFNMEVASEENNRRAQAED